MLALPCVPGTKPALGGKLCAATATGETASNPTTRNPRDMRGSRVLSSKIGSGRRANLDRTEPGRETGRGLPADGAPQYLRSWLWSSGKELPLRRSTQVMPRLTILAFVLV